jgi:hypothetical protein
MKRPTSAADPTTLPAEYFPRDASPLAYKNIKEKHYYKITLLFGFFKTFI